jgi:hypothetical protein
MPTQTQTYTYSGAPFEADVDELRFTVQDAGDDSFWLLSDQEYQWLFDAWMPLYDSMTYVAAVAAATIARKFAGIVSVSADGVSVDTSELSQRYRDLATELRDQHKDATVGGEVDISNIMVGYRPDPSIQPLRFGIGVQDNPYAGLQDYGGLSYDPFYDAEVIMWKYGSW